MSDVLISLPEKEVTIFGKTDDATQCHRMRVMVFGSIKAGSAKVITELYERLVGSDEYVTRYEVENHDFNNEEDCLKVETLASKAFRQRYMRQVDFYYDNFPSVNEVVNIHHAQGAKERYRFDAEKVDKIEQTIKGLDIRDRQVMMEIRSLLFQEELPKVYEEMWGSW